MKEAFIWLLFGIVALVFVPLLFIIFLKGVAFFMNMLQRKGEIEEEASNLNPETFHQGDIFCNFHIPSKINMDISIGEIKEIREKYDTIYLYLFKWISENELLLHRKYQPKTFLAHFNNTIRLSYKAYIKIQDDQLFISGRLFPWGMYQQIFLILFFPTVCFLGLLSNFSFLQVILSVVFGIPISLYFMYLALKEPKESITKAIQLISNEAIN